MLSESKSTLMEYHQVLIFLGNCTSKVICWWIDTRIIFVEGLKYFLFWFLAFLSEDWFYLPLPTFLPKLLSKRCITVETQPWETFWLPSFEISQISSWNHISSFYSLTWIQLLTHTEWSTALLNIFYRGLLRLIACSCEINESIIG